MPTGICSWLWTSMRLSSISNPSRANHFIRRREPYFRSWDPIAINKRSETEALVTVRIDRMMEASQSFYKMPVKETWVLGERAGMSVCHNLHRKPWPGSIPGRRKTRQRRSSPESFECSRSR